MTSAPSTVGDAARRVLDHLKRHAPATTGELASALGVTAPAIRLQLDALVDRGFVEGRSGPTAGRGRPPTVWVLTGLAMDLFPDRHGDLTVELLDAIKSSLGAEGLSAVLAERDERQRGLLEAAMAAERDLGDRVSTLARHRSEQGYMAEVVTGGEHLLLIEHHCPVCEAATACQGLCSGELQLFQDVLGPDAEVERTEHLLSGDRRCVYQIRRR